MRMKVGCTYGNDARTGVLSLVAAACVGVSAFAAGGASVPAGHVRPFANGERATFLGDSITHGGLYHANLQLFWDLRFPGSGTRLMNCGVSGGTAGGGAARWERDVLPQNADRVFVMFGMNDVGHGDYETTRFSYDVLPRRKGLETVSFQPEPKFDKSASARRKARLDAFRKNMAQIADGAQAAGKRLVVVTPTPYDEYGDLYATERRMGVNSQGLASFAEACRELAAERKAELLDLHAPLTEFVRAQRDFMFCRKTDRVHPTPAGHIIMTALMLEAMGVSPVVAQVEMDAAGRVSRLVRAEVSDVKASPDGISFRYAPTSLPFPASDDYREADSVYPVSEKMNMETLIVSGLASGDYVLAADGAPLGTFSAGQLSEGVNLALLATPGTRLAMEAWEISRELASAQSRLRSIVLVEEVSAGHGAKLGDYDDICDKMTAFVQNLKKKGSSSAEYYAGKLDAYRRDKAHVGEIRAQEDDCRRRLAEAASRKASYVLSLNRAASVRSANVEDNVICWGYILDNTPTACPFMIGRTDFSLERATGEFGAKQAMYMNSMFNREYARNSFPYWSRECFENCIDNRMTDVQLDKLRDVPEVWCAAMHGGKLASAIKIAKASLRHPNIVGINFDDFCMASAEEETLEKFRAMRSAVRAINPRLRIAVVSYAKDANGTNIDLSPYRGEIDLVSRWKWVADTNYWHHLRADIAELRRQVGPRAKIVQGLYFHDFSSSIEKGADPLPLDYLKLSVNTALDAVADGTLDGVILPQVAWYSAPTHRAQYEWLRDRMLSLPKSRAVRRANKTAASDSSGSAVAPVAFKDAAKIKSWDAWGDHKGPQAWKEKRCVTRERLLKMDPGLEPAGQLETRQAKDVSASRWSIGCETLDRDYADWNQYSRFLPSLGCTRGRLFSGWAKTEQEKGVYDFAWLDPQVREMAAMGIKPWICISYGNPVWGSDFRLGMRVKQVTGNPESFAAWLRYVKALVERYRDVVNEWEIWNEPFGQAEEYAEMVYRTAKAIHEVQPKAKCHVTAIVWSGDMEKNDYYVVLERLKRENALDLVDKWIYHSYCARPEDCYDVVSEPLRRLVKSYRPEYDIFQGETGCPSQLEFAHALHDIEWTEYSQAKWDLRRALGDAARNIPSSSFTFIDLQYTFMLQSFGLIRSNTLKEPVYRRPSFFAMQNLYSYFDDDVHALGAETREVNGREMTITRFERQSRPVYAVWFSDRRPGDSLVYERADLSFLNLPRDAAWMDLMNGRIFILGDPKSVPVWDSPVVIVETQQLPRRTVWEEMTPGEIVEALYRPAYNRRLSPGRRNKMPVADEPWAKMATTNFLPCVDRFGQFKYRDWPGKVRDEAELKADVEKENADIAAHPGPKGWNEYGGWTKGPQLKATGRFRAEKIDGKWWLVDPEGRLFWSWGVVRVTPSSAVTPLNGNPRTPRTGGSMPDRDCLFEDLPAPGTPLAQFYDTYDSLLRPFYLARGETRTYDFSAANIYRKYGDGWFERYSDMCHRRLRSWGVNTIANSSDIRICLQDRTPYAERIECQSRPISASWGSWGKFRDPFDPSFTEGVRKALEEHGREAHDKWCIGFFIDNEIQWGFKETDLAQWTLWSDDGQPAKVEFLKRLAAKGIDPKAQKVPDKELKAFTRVIVDEYFRRTRETVKAFDSGLLYLGCRFAGSARPWVIDACARYCDVVSYNIYTDELGAWRLPDGLDAPVMIGEFHFGAWDRGLFGSGLINKGSQEGRAAALRRYVESALGNPQIVGVHWHQFSDQPVTGRFDGEFFQVGWTDVCDRPYPETVAVLRSMSVYDTRTAAPSPAGGDAIERRRQK